VILPRFLIAAGICLLPALSSQAQTRINTITLERTPCYGTRLSYKVTVRQDGRVDYEGKDEVKIKGKRVAAIRGSDFARLAKKVEDIGFFSLDSEYQSRQAPDGGSIFVTDQPTCITTVTKGAVTKKVENYYGGPKGLFELEQLIDELTKSVQWTGHPDFDKDIPYYDNFPLNRPVKFRGLLQTARWESRAPGNVRGWKSKFILSLMRNSESFDIKASKSINLADSDGYVVEATGTLTKGAVEDYTFNVNGIRRIRRYADRFANP